MSGFNPDDVARMARGEHISPEAYRAILNDPSAVQDLLRLSEELHGKGHPPEDPGADMPAPPFTLEQLALYADHRLNDAALTDLIEEYLEEHAPEMLHVSLKDLLNCAVSLKELTAPVGEELTRCVCDRLVLFVEELPELEKLALWESLSNQPHPVIIRRLHGADVPRSRAPQARFRVRRKLERLLGSFNQDEARAVSAFIVHQVKRYVDGLASPAS